MSLREFVRPGEELFFFNDLLRAPKVDCKAAAAAAVAQPAIARGCTLYDRIRERQHGLESERWSDEARKRHIEELEAEVAACGRRHELRIKRQKLQELEEAKAELAFIQSGRKLEQFQEATKPYVKEYQRQQFCKTSEATDELFPAASKDSRVLEDFLVNVEGQAPKFQIQHSDVCGRCGEQLQLQQSLSMLICSKCGSSKPFLDATASLLAYSDDFDFSSFSYKRITHFGECLCALQAKEAIEVPEAVLEAIMQRLYDERVQNVDEITVHKVREVLKKLKLRKYYEHVQLITCKITGRAPPRMTPEMEERLKVCFLAASAAFQRHIPEGRKNMVSYSLVCQKLCILLGYTEFIPLFAPLKSRDKMAKADACWALICRDLNWPFTPSQ
jgi:Poxvirus Late Transcription Factor VLTF3 like